MVQRYRRVVVGAMVMALVVGLSPAVAGASGPAAGAGAVAAPAAAGGYWLAASDGGIFSFAGLLPGDVRWWGVHLR
jgi:hypothetical protein